MLRSRDRCRDVVGFNCGLGSCLDSSVDGEFAPGLSGIPEVGGHFLLRLEKGAPHVVDGLVPGGVGLVQLFPRLGPHVLEPVTVLLSHIVDPVSQVAPELFQRLVQFLCPLMMLVGDIRHESSGRAEQVMGCVVDLTQRVCAIFDRHSQVVR